MHEFTFGVLTYNQEKYILEHLESIKYQIEHFGLGYDINIVISDDCSTDRTIALCDKWFVKNKMLFNKIDILRSAQNKGIVKNMVRLLKNINTDAFKILAGDDLYYKNNIFSLMEKHDIVLTSSIQFYDDCILSSDKNYNFRELLLQNNTKEYLINRLEYFNLIEAPGVFFRHVLVDSNLYIEMLKYTWIEDVPMWKNLFNIENIDIYIDNRVYILYRDNVGISSNLNHPKRKGFLEDQEKLEKEIFIKNRFPYSVLQRWKKSIFKRIIKYYGNQHNNEIIEFNNERANIKIEGEQYIKYIVHQASEYR